MGINPETIARAGLGLLNDVGLDGLTMRMVADELGVRAPTLYWHVKNKQELLDAMATLIYVEGVDGLEAPERDVAWDEWLATHCGRTRRAMLRYRDGARILAGSNVTHPAMFRTIELTLRTLQDAGFSVAAAARAVPPLLHYTVGFTIEEQARTGIAYGDRNPYQDDPVAKIIDEARFPLTARMLTTLLSDDHDADFEHGLGIILAGLRAERGDPE